MEQLSFQIAHALFRVCRNIKQKDLRGRIEAYSIYLLELAGSNDYENIERSLTTIQKLVCLCEETGEIHYIHTQVLYSQFANLRKLLEDTKERAKIELAIEDIFTGDYEKYTKGNIAIASTGRNLLNSMNEDSANVNSNRHNAAIDKNNDIDLPISTIYENDHQVAKRSSLSEVKESAISMKKKSRKTGAKKTRNLSLSLGPKRQELISETIKELGKAAMKDIIAALPNVSERTLRNDLKKMMSNQVIKRIGSGGPACYYVIKNDFIAQDLLG